MLSSIISVLATGLDRTDPSPSSTCHSRDMSKRQTVASNELLRRAYKYISRNTTIPTRVRHQAQLALNDFPNKSRREVVKERCTETGRGRGIITEFGLCRVSSDDNSEIGRQKRGQRGTGSRTAKRF